MVLEELNPDLLYARQVSLVQNLLSLTSLPFFFLASVIISLEMPLECIMESLSVFLDISYEFGPNIEIFHSF